jgi:sigma-B regulation protein RsbU (phosphoserine phosphatase)
MAMASPSVTPAARLTEISRALTYARSLDQVLELTVECAADLLGAPRVVLMLIGDDHLLHVRASRGIDADAAEEFRQQMDEHLLVRLERLLGHQIHDYFLGVPLVNRAAVIGLLAVRRAESGPADPSSELVLSALADQAAVAIDAARERDLRGTLEVKVGDLERQHSSHDQAIRFLSHDIRTALSSIDGYASLMAGGVLGEVNERQIDALERIRQVGTHLLSLLGNATELARLRTEGMAFRTTPLILGDVVTDAVNVVIPVAHEANIEIAVRPGPRVEVVTDRHRLRQVLVQLLDNAVKYSPARTTVTVTTRVQAEGDQDWGEVTVTDQGPGIPAQHLQTIFKPYQRIDSSAPGGRTVSGLGLGLAIAQSLVERMGGSIIVKSEVGKGSSFAVRMPLSGPA